MSIDGVAGATKQPTVVGLSDAQPLRTAQAAAAALSAPEASLRRQTEALITGPKGAGEVSGPSEFQYAVEQFADIQILRYQVPGFDTLSLGQKKLAYYLHEAALAGRDIAWDQKSPYNLTVRRTLEAILRNYSGDRQDPEFAALVTYAKRIWVSNGIHHHYSTQKMEPGFSSEFFGAVLRNLKTEQLPMRDGETTEAFAQRLHPVLFDPTFARKGVNRDPSADVIADSANNFYQNLTAAEVEAYYDRIIDRDDPRPVMHGLNSRLVKRDGKIVEEVWSTQGLYGPALQRIVSWLKRAEEVAENDAQRLALGKLIEFYETGDLRTFDDYNKAWVKDTDSRVDVVNGFIETYGDAIGKRGSYESVVSIRDLEASKRIATVSDHAQWFEDHSPILDEHKKDKVVGISAKVITVVVESGDAAPTTPIGINLPNSEWIRDEYGSRSVTIGNIIHAYDESKAGNGTLQEFSYSPEEVARAQKYGSLAHVLHVDMHEVIGHASGSINDGVGQPSETLREYAATLEEARADLVALYFTMDPKLIELGLMPNLEVGKTEYDSYIRGGFIGQLSRIKEGEDIEEDHMRNRQLICKWAYERGLPNQVIERVKRDGKTFFVVRDYNALQTIFGELLRELQRIKSEGDYDAGRDLVETYGVEVDQELHREVLERYGKLNVAPYNAFIQPKLVPVMHQGNIVDVKVTYPEDFTAQMLEYGAERSTLANEPTDGWDKTGAGPQLKQT